MSNSYTRIYRNFDSPHIVQTNEHSEFPNALKTMTIVCEGCGGKIVAVFQYGLTRIADSRSGVVATVTEEFKTFTYFHQTCLVKGTRYMKFKFNREEKRHEIV